MKRVNSYKVPKYFFRLQVLLLFFFHATFVYASRPDTLQAGKDTFNRKTFWWITAGHGAVYAGSLTALAAVWYDDFDKTRLHAFNDMNEWGGMDKAGHVYTAWQLSNFSYSLYRYTGLSQEKAAWAGASFAMLYQTTLEFFDGYSAKWGFSFGDMGANLLGASLSFLRNTGRLRNFQLKFSWHKTKYPAYRADVLGKTIPEQMLKDYNGQTYWLSFNFPAKWFSEKRNWLCVSAGYSIDGYTGGKLNYYDASVTSIPYFKRTGEFYLSLDLDFSKFNIRKKWLREMVKVFNVIKVPCPAIGINASGKVLFKPLGY